ncbi:MAG: histidine triad nucleotide-binding protein [Candidatus Sumerlaeia bacterium]|nr:histidine triad nucleotide-binding protein [Candidatus Sumerlaeia bacterium]
METIFSKILDGRIPAERLHEDEHCIAIRDINPQAPVHLLVIPRKPIATLSALNKEDAALVGHVTWVATQLAQSHGFAAEGFRLVWNCNQHGGQEVLHLHLHVLAGRQMKWPPG